jgi:hypothetical protein
MCERVRICTGAPGLSQFVEDFACLRWRLPSICGVRLVAMAIVLVLERKRRPALEFETKPEPEVQPKGRKFLRVRVREPCGPPASSSRCTSAVTARA